MPDEKRNYLKIFLIALVIAVVFTAAVYVIKIKREFAIERSIIQENNIQSNEEKGNALTPDKVRESLQKAGADMNAKPISPEDVRKNLKTFGVKENTPPLTPEEVQEALEEAINK